MWVNFISNEEWKITKKGYKLNSFYRNFNRNWEDVINF